MNLSCLVALCLIAVPDRPMPKLPPMAKSVQEALLGDWKLESAIVGGEQRDRAKEKATTMTFTPTMIHVTENGKRQDRDDVNYKLDLSKNPIEIDLIPIAKDRPTMPPIAGIIKVEGNLLTLCFAFGGEGSRPTAFAVQPNSTAALMVFSRIQKK